MCTGRVSERDWVNGPSEWALLAGGRWELVAAKQEREREKETDCEPVRAVAAGAGASVRLCDRVLPCLPANWTEAGWSSLFALSFFLSFLNFPQCAIYLSVALPSTATLSASSRQWSSLSSRLDDWLEWAPLEHTGGSPHSGRKEVKDVHTNTLCLSLSPFCWSVELRLPSTWLLGLYCLYHVQPIGRFFLLLQKFSYFKNISFKWWVL